MKCARIPIRRKKPTLTYELQGESVTHVVETKETESLKKPNRSGVEKTKKTKSDTINK